MFSNLITAAILHKFEALRLRPPSKTNALPNMSERDQALWPAFIEEYLDRILEISEPIRQWAQTIGWFDEFKTKSPASKLDKIIKKAKKAPKPGPKTKPLHLTKKAEGLWDEFWKKYNKTINKVPDIEKRWATALAIFRNYCLKRNVKPFKDETTSAKDSSEYLLKRWNSARKKLIDKSKITLKQFKRTIGRRILKEKLTSIKYSTKDKGYNVTTTSILNLNPNQTFGKKDVLEYFKSKGFTKKGRKYIQKVGNHTIIVTPGDSNNKINYNLIVRFTRKQLEQLVGEAVNKKELEKKLNVFVRKNLKEKHISNIIANIVSSELESLKKIQDEDITKDEAIGKYTADYILGLGDSDYRMKLAKVLLSKYGENDSWSDFINQPDLTKDDYVSDLQDEYESDMENDI